MIRGNIPDVDTFLMYLRTRMVMLPFKTKEGKDMTQPINLRLNYSVFGTYEAVFPENEKDVVLTTLRFHEPLHPNTVKMRWMVKMIRLAIGLKKVPEFSTKMILPMPNEAGQNVHIIPLGVKYDKMSYWFHDTGEVHEAI